MQELGGYIKLYRKLLWWGWYQDSTVKELFLHLLLKAAFKAAVWQGQSIKAGQLITSRRQLAEELGMTEEKIRNALKKLVRSGEVTCRATNRYTLITIVNWEKYQAAVENATSNESLKRPTDNQQTTNKQPHRNNVYNYKKDNNIHSFSGYDRALVEKMINSDD